MTEFILLGKDQKRVVAKSLMDLNYSATEISRLLDVDRTTVYRYNKEPTPDELLQFATEIKTILSVKQFQILAKIVKRLDFLVEKSLDLRTLINAYQIIKNHTPSLYTIYRDQEREKRMSKYII